MNRRLMKIFKSQTVVTIVLAVAALLMICLAFSWQMFILGCMPGVTCVQVIP